jgi:hypothetical protein
MNATLASLDSDGDGFSNGAEVTARTYPGDPLSFPVASDTTAPSVTGFTVPASSSSLTVSGISITATDAVGVTGYIITESSIAPAASAAGWVSVVSTTSFSTTTASYTAASAGAKTLYVYTKDAAGNVSTSRSAPVTITLPDTIAPTVTSFVIPATSNSLTVPITAFSATDNVGVTGFILTESATKPTASAAGWTVTPPTSYTFATAGTKTLYAWAKDAASNVSNSQNTTVTITLAETPLGMSIWIGKWFKISEKHIGYKMQDSSWARYYVTFVAYIKIYDWDPDKNILKADRYEYDAESGQWFTEPFTLNYLSGSVLDFLCSAHTIDEQTNSTYGFTARISGLQRQGILEARFKTLGGYYVSVINGEPDNEYSSGNLIIQGKLISESDIPVPADILLN